MPQLKTWQAAEFEIDQAHEELACWLMMQLGSTGCRIRQLDETTVCVSAVFEELGCRQIVDLKTGLKQYGLENELKNLRVTTVAEEDWLAKWKENLRPIRVGKKLMISPPWFAEEIESQANKTNDACVIYIEPGMAFGTGLHATTQYCLKVLEDQLQCTDFLDVGTGSGILAIAAAKLNSQAKIFAVDNNPECVEVAQQNIKLNGVEKQIRLCEGSTQMCNSLSFDCIMANLTFEDIDSLLLEFLRLLRPAGRLILAGILAEKLTPLEKAIESFPLAIVDRKIDGEWIGITMERIPVKLSAGAKTS